MNILHLANSTLAGAPGMLSDALNDYSPHQSALLQFNDKGAARNLFQPSACYVGLGARDLDLLEHMIGWADLIHIHNIVPAFVLAALARADLERKKTVYQIHSPSYEPPIFGDVSKDMGIDFDHRLVLGHFHARQHPDFEIVPNCLHRRTLYLDTKQLRSGPVRILFSPSSPKKGRWGAKSTPMVDQHLKALSASPNIEVIEARDIAPETLLMHRKASDITIDEVLTGAYHLVSYEGLACGNVVVNACDDLSEMMFKSAFRTSSTPPFVKSSPEDLIPALVDLARDRVRLSQLQQESLAFFWDVMAADKVVPIYCDIYERPRTEKACLA